MRFNTPTHTVVTRSRFGRKNIIRSLGGCVKNMYDCAKFEQGHWYTHGRSWKSHRKTQYKVAS